MSIGDIWLKKIIYQTLLCDVTFFLRIFSYFTCVCVWFKGYDK